MNRKRSELQSITTPVKSVVIASIILACDLGQWFNMHYIGALNDILSLNSFFCNAADSHFMVIKDRFVLKKSQ